MSRSAGLRSTVSPRSLDLTRQPALTTSLVDLSPGDVGRAATAIRRLLLCRGFQEAVLNPFDKYPVDYLDAAIDVPSVGQLRFNTEPEIWETREHADRFFSVTHLYRRETEQNCLRRSSFIIIDFYQPGEPDGLLNVFGDIVVCLAERGFTNRLSCLPLNTALYDPEQDSPQLTSSAEATWVLASGYDAANSFFEVDADGTSTRRELFLVTPQGYLEIGVMGIAGYNTNPNYKRRPAGQPWPMPPGDLCGMGFGLERLLLAEQILALNPR